MPPCACTPLPSCPVREAEVVVLFACRYRLLMLSSSTAGAADGARLPDNQHLDDQPERARYVIAAVRSAAARLPRVSLTRARPQGSARARSTRSDVDSRVALRQKFAEDVAHHVVGRAPVLPDGDVVVVRNETLVEQVRSMEDPTAAWTDNSLFRNQPKFKVVLRDAVITELRQRVGPSVRFWIILVQPDCKVHTAVPDAARSSAVVVDSPKFGLVGAISLTVALRALASVPACVLCHATAACACSRF